VSSDPYRAERKRGAALGHELEEFVKREVPDREARAQVLLGALEYLERQTSMHRPGSPWPVESDPDAPPDLN
jgi:hypothetical protein